MKNISKFGQYAVNEASIPVSKIAMDAAIATEDAYSFDKYGKAEWIKIAQFLVDKGYDQSEVEFILNSKFMRWAGDNLNKNSGLTLGIFKKLYDTSTKEIDKMLKLELGDTRDLEQKFRDGLTDLIVKYKGKISDSKISQVLRDALEHKIR